MKEEFSDYMNDIIKSMELSQDFIQDMTFESF